MKKNTLIPAIIFLLLSITAIILISKDNKETAVSVNKKSSEIILFYGTGCPHCLIVDRYIEENEIDKKISFDHLEVYYNKKNSSLLAEKAASCGINTNRIGVPLLWEDDQCFIGDKQIINFFNEKIK